MVSIPLGTIAGRGRRRSRSSADPGVSHLRAPTGRRDSTSSTTARSLAPARCRGTMCRAGLRWRCRRCCWPGSLCRSGLAVRYAGGPAWSALGAVRVRAGGAGDLRHATIYDGIRHLLFIVPPLTALAAARVDRCADSRTPRALVVAALASGCSSRRVSAPQSSEPDRVLQSAVRRPKAAFARYDMDYWANSVLQAVKWSADSRAHRHTARRVRKPDPGGRSGRRALQDVVVHAAELGRFSTRHPAASGPRTRFTNSPQRRRPLSRDDGRRHAALRRAAGPGVSARSREDSPRALITINAESAEIAELRDRMLHHEGTKDTKTLKGLASCSSCLRGYVSTSFITKDTKTLRARYKIDHRFQVVPTDQGTRQREKGFVDTGTAFVPYRQAAKSMQPGQGSFHDPAGAAEASAMGESALATPGDPLRRSWSRWRWESYPRSPWTSRGFVLAGPLAAQPGIASTSVSSWVMSFRFAAVNSRRAESRGRR